MPSNSKEVIARIFKLQSTINMDMLEGKFNPELFAGVLQDFLEKKGGLVTLSQAIKILGKAKVISAKVSSLFWGVKSPHDLAIFYSEEILRKAAEANEAGQDWRLVYCHGFSLFEQFEILKDRTQGPRFKRLCSLSYHPESSMFRSKRESGYYLIDFSGRFGDKQGIPEEEISKLREDFEKCHEALFAESFFTIFYANNGERIAANWAHQGYSVLEHITVGRYDSLDEEGLEVETSPFHMPFCKNIRVCVLRKLLVR